MFDGYASWLSALYYHWSIFWTLLVKFRPDVTRSLMLIARTWALPPCHTIPRSLYFCYVFSAPQLPFLHFSPAYDQPHQAKASPLTDCCRLLLSSSFIVCGFGDFLCCMKLPLLFVSTISALHYLSTNLSVPILSPPISTLAVSL